MSIADQLTQLNQIKLDIKQALIDKGVDMAGVPFAEYPSKINEINGLSELEYIDCTVSGVGSTSGVTVTMPEGGYYEYYLTFSYQQFDRSNEEVRYIDSKGTPHTILRMEAGAYGQSPGFSVNLCLDLTLYETPEAIKSMTSFKINFSPNKRNPHFNSFKAQALRKL